MEVPKHMYFYWGNETISFLRFMTIKSFIHHNPDFEVTLITKRNKTKLHENKTTFIEQQDNSYFDGKDYTKELMNLDINYEILEEDYTEIAQLSVPDSSIDDILTWYILGYKGGFKADMDIMFTHPIKYELYKDIDASIFFYGQNCAIGFLFGTPNEFWQNMYSSIGQIKQINYQSYGGNFMKYFVTEVGNIYMDLNIQVINNRIIYPFIHTDTWEDQLDKPFKEKIIYKVDEEIFGIHWYGGWPTAQKYNLKLTKENYLESRNTISYYIDEVLKNE